MKITFQAAIELMTMFHGNGDICKKNELDCGFMVNDGCMIVTARDGKKPYPFESADFYGEKWEIFKETLTRDYIIGYLSESLADADFITPEIIEKMADIFLPLSEKPDFCKIDAEKEKLAEIIKERGGLSKPAPESEKVLTICEWEIAEPNAYPLTLVNNPAETQRIYAKLRRLTFEFAHNNGRLERDLELMLLVDAFKAPCINIDDWARRINHELKNLKPLKAE